MKTIAHKIRRPVTIVITVLVLASVPGVALAQSDEHVPPRDRQATDQVTRDRPERDIDLDALKERILAAIEKRLEALDRLADTVDENEHLTKEHAKDLQDDYKDAKKTLEGAAKDVEKAETVAELREIVPGVFQETLVFALLGPKTHLVIASDTIVDAAERFAGFGEHLQAIIDRLRENGHDVTAAQAALDEMIALIEMAAETAGPVAGNVIDLDSTDWPDPAKAALEKGHADVESARASLRNAREKAHQVLDLIRELWTDRS